jgi:hypothetical protein
MKAELMTRDRLWLSDTAMVEIVVWKLPSPASGSEHSFKYRLALVSDTVCVMRYDNEAGKGDHKHIGDIETSYRFTDIATLLADFRADVERWQAAQ